MKKKVNGKYIVAFVLLFICSFLFLIYKVQILDAVKIVLSSTIFFIIITFIVFSIAILYKFKFSETKFSDLTNLKEFNKIIPDIISLITEPSTFVCSFSILRGLYLDYFYNETYFFKFNDTEKSFLFIAAFYFLIYTFIEIKKEAQELFFDTAEVEKPSEN